MRTKDYDDFYLHALLERSNVYWLKGESRNYLEDIKKGYEKAGHTGSSTDRMMFRIQEADYIFSKGEFTEAANMYASLYRKFEKAGEMQYAARCLSNIGFCYGRLGSLKKEIEFNRKALALYSEVNDISGKAYCLNNIAAYYYKRGDYEKQLNFLNNALEAFQSIGHKMGEALCLNNLGALYNKTGDIDKQIIYFRQSLKIRESIGFTQGTALLYNNLGMVYGKKGNMEKHLYYLQRAIDIYSDTGNKWGLALVYNNRGYVCSKTGHFDCGYTYLKKAYSLCKDISDANRLVSVLENLCSLYYEQDKLALGNECLIELKALSGKIDTPETAFKYKYCRTLKQLKEYCMKERKLNRKSAMSAADSILSDSAKLCRNKESAMARLLAGRFFLLLHEYERASGHFAKAKELIKQTGDALILNEIDMHCLKMLQMELEETGECSLRRKIRSYENKIDQFLISANSLMKEEER
ncbi:MAG: tetratricopeptide repeat protein [bacterium]